MGSDPVSGAFQHTSGGNELRRIVFAPPDGQMKIRGCLPGFDRGTRTNVFYHVMHTPCSAINEKKVLFLYVVIDLKILIMIARTFWSSAVYEPYKLYKIKFSILLSFSLLLTFLLSY